MGVEKDKLVRYDTYYDRKKLHGFSKQMNKKLGDFAPIIAIEELSELIQATSKFLRFDKGAPKNQYHERDRLNIIEELADATIALDIIKASVGVPQDEINQMINYKLDKKVQRLNSGNMVRKR